MTKKRVIAIVVSGIMLFFMAAAVMNFGVVYGEKAEEFRNDTLKIKENLAGYDVEYFAAQNNKNSAEKTGMSLGELLLYDYVIAFAPVKYAAAFAVREYPEQELRFAPKNFVRVIDWSDYTVRYINLDDYLTSELEKVMAQKNKNYYYKVKQLCAYVDGKDYIPTELVLYNWTDEPDLVYKLSDYPTTVRWGDDTEGIGIDLAIDQYFTPFYNMKLEEDARENLIDFFELNKDGGYEDGTSGRIMSATESLGDFNITIDGKNYQIFYSLKNNTVMDTLLSKEFLYLTVYLAILFFIAGTIFLIICLKIWEKGERLDRARKTFISAASHELKTPLAVIQNQCECLMEDIVPEKREEYISSVYDEALRMNEIVNSLLGYNRISQLTAVSKENCNLSLILKEELEKYRSFAESRGTGFVVSIAEDVYANCNGELIKMTIDNLLSNAVKYSAGDNLIAVELEKGFCMRVSNSATEENGEAVCRGWELLEKGNTSRERDGASIGMGLPLCKRILQLHKFTARCKYRDGMVEITIKPSGR